MTNNNAFRFIRYIAPFGREGVYAEKIEAGYRPVWKKLSPLVLERHLNNNPPIGIYLINGKNEVGAGVFDFDDHDGSAGFDVVKAAALNVAAVAKTMGLKVIPFLSGGGMGIHFWVLFHNPQKARAVRRLMKRILEVAGLSDGTKGVIHGEVEIFPKQDQIEAKGLGNLVALPGARHSVPLDPVSFEPISWDQADPDAMLMMSNSDVPDVEDEEGTGAGPIFKLAGDEKEVQEALRFVSADDYTMWLQIGLAIKLEFGESGAELFIEWSSGCRDKYDGPDSTWQFYDRLKPRGSLTLGTIFYHARKRGWQGPSNSLIREMNAKYGILTFTNKTMIVVKSGNLIDETLTWLAKQQFLDRLAPEFIEHKAEDGKVTRLSKAKLWLSHSKACHYDALEFDPLLPPGHNGRVWNIWKGFALEPVQGDWSLMKAHILTVISRGDPERYEWLLNWMAMGIQNRNTPIGTAPVFIGMPGTGKGIVAQNYGALWGAHYLAVTHTEHVIGRFSGHLMGKRFIFLDEAMLGGSRKEAGVIKTRLTDPWITFEQKGIDPVKMKNRMIFMAASNETSVVPADVGDRRWTIFHVSDERREDHKYFGEIQDQMDNGGLAAMLHELSTRDLTKGPNPRKVIKSEGLFDQMLYSQTPDVRYIFTLLDGGRLPQNHVEDANVTTIKALVQDLKRNYSDAQAIDSARLGRIFAKILSGLQTSPSGKFQYAGSDGHPMFERSTRYVFPALGHARKAFERYVNMPVTWSAVDAWQQDPDPSDDDVP